MHSQCTGTSRTYRRLMKAAKEKSFAQHLSAYAR